MKKLLMLILTVISVSCYGQKDTLPSKFVGKDYDSLIAKASNFSFRPIKSTSYVLYRIDSDGKITFSDFFLDALIKQLEAKGYYMNRAGLMPVLGSGTFTQSSSPVTPTSNFKKQ